MAMVAQAMVRDLGAVLRPIIRHGAKAGAGIANRRGGGRVVKAAV